LGQGISTYTGCLLQIFLWSKIFKDVCQKRNNFPLPYELKGSLNTYRPPLAHTVLNRATLAVINSLDRS
jgi:hypothetical protein